ncbi:hypothetical protein [Sporosarcina highlanderae]|uniref:Uncharacterized protein n=1 Tax=Sporosarcina highlanderae TaxID=3035916 RepID=A0ABT8JVR2_9BACL|nr:hypothetical protein [Sporosarcina highlanderae]MDN4608641.1 hypothetical protein [Sporosarcina highlanderae]
MITSRQLYHEEPQERPLMPTRQATSTPATPVKIARIVVSARYYDSSRGDTVTINAVDMETGDIIAAKTISGMLSPARIFTAKNEVKTNIIEAGYTVEGE